MAVIDEFFHPDMQTSNHDSSKSIMTGSGSPSASAFQSGVSVDQLLAERLAPDTRFTSLSLSVIERGVSWDARGGWLPAIHDANKLKELLFEQDDVTAEKRAMDKQLEVIASNLEHVSPKTPYAQVMKNAEQEIRRKKTWLSTPKPKVDLTLRKPGDFAFHDQIMNMFDVMHLALKTDSTRVIALNIPFGDDVIRMPGMDEAFDWHKASHHGNGKVRLENLIKIETAMLQAYDYFLSKLENTIVDGEPLLANTTVVFLSDLGNASVHSHDNLPVMVVGGSHQHRGHIHNQEPHRLCNLFLELLIKSGVNVKQFGSSNRVGEWLS